MVVPAATPGVPPEAAPTAPHPPRADPPTLAVVLDALRDALRASRAAFVPLDPSREPVWCPPISGQVGEVDGLTTLARTWLAGADHRATTLSGAGHDQVGLAVVRTDAGDVRGALLVTDPARDDGDAPTALRTASLVAARLTSAILDSEPDQHDRQGLLDWMHATPGGRTAFAVSIDRLSVINAVLGYPAGDAVLQKTRRRLVQWAGPDSRLARGGGARYIVVRTDVSDAHLAQDAADQLRTIVAAPVTIDGDQLSRSVSVGVATDPDGTVAPADLIAAAVRSAIEARDSGGDATRIFDDEAARTDRDQLRLELELHNALQAGQLRMHYQPELDLRSGRIVGVEALLRWEHPMHGLLGAERFVPDNEQTHTFADVQRWIIDETCRQLAAWQHDGLADNLVLRVNVAARQLTRGDLTTVLLDALERHGLRGGQVCVELTERSLPSDTAALTVQLAKWRERGVTVAIDDFGTGEGTLSHLLALPLDVVKVDQTFVAGLLSDERAGAVVSGVISLARSLHLDVVAEGVDGQNTAAELVRLGCTRGQGNALAPAMDADHLAELLRGQGSAFHRRLSG